MPDATYMRKAVELAKAGAGWTNPNPLVGAVVVKDGRVIGAGCHERYGQAHAERNALARCGEDPHGATLYVTLEPCCHHGKQPPCTDAVVEAGISRVVVGSRDPNPLVAGKGNELLRAAGIEVVEDFLREECDALNPIFFRYIPQHMPVVVAKWAMTADGHIACATGDAKWVSGEAARQDVQCLRHRLAGIMVGIGTVLADDPLLTCRLEGGNTPVRIVVDSRLRIPLESQLVRTAHEVSLVVACSQCDAAKAAALEAAGVRVLECPGACGRVDLRTLMQRLGTELSLDSILLEGGAGLNASMFGEGLAAGVVCYVAPKLCGGMAAPSPIGGEGVLCMTDATPLEMRSCERIGDDVKLVYEVV